jgi:O-antigen/teichoic acid export membrane protein
MSVLERLVKGSVSAFAARMLGIICAFIANGFMARMLSPADMGTYFLLYSFAIAGATVATLGTNYAVVKFIAEAMATERHGRARKAIVTALQLTLLTSVALGSVYILMPTGSYRVFIAMWALMLSIQSVISESFRGFHDIHMAGAFGSVLTPFLTASVLACLWLAYGCISLPNVLAISVGIVCAVIVFGGLALYIKTYSFPRGEEKCVRPLLRMSLPMWVNTVVFLGFNQSALWVVSAYRPDTDLALYGAALRLVNVISTPLVILNAVVPPIIAELYTQGKTASLQRALRVAATVAGAPAVVVLLTFVFFGGQALTLVFGSYYRTAGSILAILSAGQLVYVWIGASGHALSMTGHQDTLMWITVLVTLTSIPCFVYAVRNFGTAGLAVTSAIACTVQSILMLVATRWRIGIWTHAEWRLDRLLIKGGRP